jgi:hypothetical protein
MHGHGGVYEALCAWMGLASCNKGTHHKDTLQPVAEFDYICLPPGKLMANLLLAPILTFSILISYFSAAYKFEGHYVLCVIPANFDAQKSAMGGCEFSLGTKCKENCVT